jgi:glycerate 2-kinase
MKILIAPDSFKHSLSSKDAAAHIAKGILLALPEAEIILAPMADGGEGTVQTIVDATIGKIIKTKAHDPLMREVESFFGAIGDGETAVIEMAAASGLELLADEERNPMVTTTFGTGELIKAALDLGYQKLIIGVGGSATNDGGTGMASALGVKFLDKYGNEIGLGGGALAALEGIDISGLDQRLKSCEITVAADVTNPLTGIQGAAKVYASQKGATAEEVEALEQNLRHYALILKTKMNVDIGMIAGAGAAGGLGAGLMVFANAKTESGFDVVSRIVRLEDKIKDADLVITGEGKIDHQTQFGKTAFGVATLAKNYHKPVIAFAGICGEGYQELYHKGFDLILPISDKPLPLSESLKNAGQLLQNAAERLAKDSFAGLFI